MYKYQKEQIGKRKKNVLLIKFEGFFCIKNSGTKYFEYFFNQCLLLDFKCYYGQHVIFVLQQQP